MVAADLHALLAENKLGICQGRKSEWLQLFGAYCFLLVLCAAFHSFRTNAKTLNSSASNVRLLKLRFPLIVVDLF